MMRTLLLVFVGLLFMGILQGDEPQQDRIKERVSVVNVEVVVRVFRKGQPVSGLKKENFTLLVNRRPVSINGFYELKKKIKEDSPAGSRLRKPRFFILIFNISDNTLDMEQGLNQFFKDVICLGDRFMVITNNFFIQDRILIKPFAEEKKVLKILELEAKKYRYLLFNSRNTLKEFLRSFYDEWKSIPELRDSTILRYQDIYLHYLRDFKKYFLSINESQYIQIADYIKKQKLETWVLNFYQIGGWYRPHINSTLETFLLQNEIMHELDVGNQLPVKKLSRLFAGTSATFQTILMRPVKQFDVTCDFWDKETGIGGPDWQFDYTFLPTPSENLLKKTSQITGGVLLHGNRIDRFLEQVVAREDITYTLTYVPQGDSAGKDRIRVTVNRPRCRVYYNSQPVQRAPTGKENGPEKKRSQVVLYQVNLSGADLFVKAAGFHFKKTGSSMKAKARLRIRILNEKFKIFYDRFMDFEFSGDLEQQIHFRDKLLKPGKYNMIVEVNDLQYTSSDMVIYDIKVAANGRIISIDG